MAFAQAQQMGSLHSVQSRPCMPARKVAIGASWRSVPAREQQRPKPSRAALRRGLVVCTAEVLESERLRLQLPTADFQQNAELTALRRRRGGTAILIFDVTPGSAAWQAGVRPGQQVLEISDPIRFAEVWTLNGLASLKYVRQAIQGRAGETMTLCVTTEPVPEWQQAVAATRAAVGSGATAGDEPLTAAEKAELQNQLDQMQADAVQQKQSERQKKLDTRNSYYEEGNQTDNKTPFVVGFVGLFLVLPLAILTVAFFSGYMGTLGPGRTL